MMTFPPTIHDHERFRSRAFSVLEMMVAVALLAVIIVGLLAMFYQVQRAFRAGTAQVDVMEGGRAAMNLLTRDIQEMVATQVPIVTNCVVLDSFGANAATPTSVQEFSSGAPRDNYQQDICFVSRQNDEWVGTSYRVAFADTGLGTLYRLHVRRPYDTLPSTNSQILADLSHFVCTNIDFDGLDLHRVLDGVVHLTFTLFDTNGIAYLNYRPADLAVLTAAGTVRVEPSIVAFTEANLPAYVDIELTVLEPSAVEKFNARIDSALPYPQSISRATNYLARQIGRTHLFRQRVPIRSSATDIGARFSLASP
jgi:Tfp pilus assembly protein PilV